MSLLFVGRFRLNTSYYTMGFRTTSAIVMALFIQQSSLVSAIGPLKFQQWFPYWGQYELNPAAELRPPILELCAENLTTYWTNNGTYPWTSTRALNCILNYTDQAALQMLSSSLVILGLTPGLLSTLGPSIAESSMLTLKRPTLSILLSFGAPAVYLKRAFTFDDPFNTIQTSPRTSISLVGPLSHRKYRWIVLAVEYIFALAAIGNIIYVSLDLGWRSVSSWKCESSYYPLSRVLILGFIHWLGVLSFWFTPKAIGNVVQTQDGTHSTALLALGTSQPRVIRQQPKITIYTQSTLPWTLLLQYVAMACAVGQVMYGTMVFSSLLFLMIGDAVPVLLKFAGSAIVCRFI